MKRMKIFLKMNRLRLRYRSLIDLFSLELILRERTWGDHLPVEGTSSPPAKPPPPRMHTHAGGRTETGRRVAKHRGGGGRPAGGEVVAQH